MTNTAETIACDLTATAAADQALEWKDLQGYATKVEGLPAGARMRFPSELEPRIADLASRETVCCAFLDIHTRASEDELVLEVSSQNPEALPVIAVVTGVVDS